jgi:metal-sulfur cluster biosynthetic enzyme
MTTLEIHRPDLAPVSPAKLRERVWAALGTVRDPELDESITDLTFVSEVGVLDRDVAVTLRLPTYFCAPNFAYLMVADAHDAVAAIPGVGSVQIELRDHFASAEINAGVAERAGFESAFPGQAVDDLAELRVTFQRKAYLASMERACRVLLDRGWEAAELFSAQLFDLPGGQERTSLMHRRDDLGMPTRPQEYLLTDEHGERIPESAVALKLRFAKAVRVSIEGNGHMCRGLLKVRYGTADEPGTQSGVADHADSDRVSVETSGMRHSLGLLDITGGAR